MGRIFEALQKADAVLDPIAPQPAAPIIEPEAVEDTPEPDAEDFDADGGMSFIEVGPSHSMDASPDVLATAPVAKSTAPLRPSAVAPPVDEQPRSEPVRARHVPAPALVGASVAFRAPPAPPRHEPLPTRPRLPDELVAFHCPEAPASTGYRELLQTLLSGVEAQHPAALLFTAARHGVGTTTVLLNLALTAARQHRQRVVVVDANFRRPGLSAELHVADQPGLRDVLAGTARLDDALQETEAINLFTLTTGAPATDAGLRVVAGTMRSLLRELRRRFHLILVDGPRWDGRPEVVAAGVACDAIYVVTPEAEAESPHVDQLLQIIPEQGGRLGGCLLSDALR